jgi:hypothetical protein
MAGRDSELGDALLDFEGLRWIPGISQILDGLTELDAAARAGRISPDATQTLLSTIASPDSVDITHLFALAVTTLTGPENRALDGLDEETRKAVQHLGEQHAFTAAEFAPREYTNEAAGLIYEAGYDLNPL